VTEELLDLLVRIRADGTSILLVEQDVEHALAVADRAYVMEAGRVVLAGTAGQIYDDPGVRSAYLGI